MAEFITADTRKLLGETLGQLKGKVTLMLFTKKGVNDPFNEFSDKFIREISSVSPRIRHEFHSIGDEASKKFRNGRLPCLSALKPITCAIQERPLGRRAAL